MIDLSKPVRTKNGEPRRIICTDSKFALNGKKYPVVAEYPANGLLFHHDEYGKVCGYDGDYLDLINVPSFHIYRPWTAAEAATHVGEKVKSKDGNILCTIISQVDAVGTIWIRESHRTNENLFRAFTFMDGTPCGQKVE